MGYTVDMSKRATKLKKNLIGRDHTFGRVAFKTGVTKTRKDREANRKDKYAKREKNRQLKGE